MASLKKWTMMVYFAADNELSKWAARNLHQLKSVGSTASVNLVAQLDAEDARPSGRYYLQKRKGSLDKDRVLELDGKQTAGRPGVLSDFIAWAAAQYPAEHYLVVLWGHGKGWDDDMDCITSVLQAASPDANVPLSSGAMSGAAPSAPRVRGILHEGKSQDFLSNPEFKAELARGAKAIGHKIDMLGLDACLMNMVEVAFEVRESVSILAASEETIPYQSWPYGRIADALTRSPRMSPAELAKASVDAYVEAYAGLKEKEKIITLSACDLGYVDDLVARIEDLAEGLNQSLGSPREVLGLVMARAASRAYLLKDYVDLYDFCSRLLVNSQQEGVRLACQAILSLLQEGRFIIRSGSNEDPVLHPTKYNARSHGVSIYFPSIPPCYSTDLSFAKRTRWPLFLSRYLAVLLELDWRPILGGPLRPSPPEEHSPGVHSGTSNGTDTARFIVRLSRNHTSRNNLSVFSDEPNPNRTSPRKEGATMAKSKPTEGAQRTVAERLAEAIGQKFPEIPMKTPAEQLVEILGQKFPEIPMKTPAEQLLEILNQKFPEIPMKTPAEQLLEVLNQKFPEIPMKTPADRIIEALNAALSQPQVPPAGELVYEVRIRQLSK